MDSSYSFRFIDNKLNDKLIALLAKEGVKHRIDREGVIHYSPDDEQFVGNEILPSMRDKLFPRWQIISCPAEWADRYRRYMIRHSIPFVEELIDRQMCFLISRHYRPHSWRLEESEGHPIRSRAKLDVIKRLCEILIQNRRAKKLGEEILRELPTGHITDQTYKRLSRWCNPARSEPDTQPIAARLSQELFGHMTSRMT